MSAKLSCHFQVNSKLETSCANVSAIGDVISFPVSGLGGAMRVQGHVTHARSSGIFVAKVSAVQIVNKIFASGSSHR